MTAAFPSPGVIRTSAPDEYQQGAYEGMSLRDYFAASAMQGLLASTNNTDRLEGLIGFRKISSAAYCCAEAMLQERNKYDQS